MEENAIGEPKNMEHAKIPSTLDTQWSRVSSVFEQPLWSNNMQKKLRVLLGLNSNWDSYGSPSVSPAAVETSLAILGNISRLNMPEPQVFPVSGGGIQFEWENDKCELEIEIRPDKKVEFLIVDSEGGMLEGPIYRPDDPAQIGCLTHWFIEQKDSVNDLLKAQHAAAR
jgi:hypothetical protein